MNKLDMLVQLAMQKRVLEVEDVKTLAIQVREHEATSNLLAELVKTLRERVEDLEGMLRKVAPYMLWTEEEKQNKQNKAIACDDIELDRGDGE